MTLVDLTILGIWFLIGIFAIRQLTNRCDQIIAELQRLRLYPGDDDDGDDPEDQPDGEPSGMIVGFFRKLDGSTHENRECQVCGHGQCVSCHGVECARCGVEMKPKSEQGLSSGDD